MLFKPEHLWISIVLQLAAFTVFLAATNGHISVPLQSSCDIHTVKFDFDNYTVNLFCVFKKREVLICAFCYIFCMLRAYKLHWHICWSEVKQMSHHGKTKQKPLVLLSLIHMHWWNIIIMYSTWFLSTVNEDWASCMQTSWRKHCWYSGSVHKWLVKSKHRRRR